MSVENAYSFVKIAYIASMMVATWMLCIVAIYCKRGLVYKLKHKGIPSIPNTIAFRPFHKRKREAIFEIKVAIMKAQMEHDVDVMAVTNNGPDECGLEDSMNIVVKDKSISTTKTEGE